MVILVFTGVSPFAFFVVCDLEIRPFLYFCKSLLFILLSEQL